MKMRREFGWVTGIVLASVLSVASAEQPPKSVAGTWEGESICTVPNSPCHDEHVVYEIGEDKKSAGKLELAAFKIVKGEKLYMGSLLCEYSAVKGELRCHYRPEDLWAFAVSGDTMKGTLVINNKTLYRRINVKKK